MKESFLDPPKEFSLMPFWFWNDDLDEKEIIRQIEDFEAHGVYGFVIHPRVGLPRRLGWMSAELLRFMRIAVEAAAARQMSVILYDEGMYPSGSSSGQVVAENPDFQCRCMAKVDLEHGEKPSIAQGEHLVSVVKRQGGQEIAVIDRPVDAYIRGLHYVDGGPKEDEPRAGDLLNPDSVDTFVRLVYDGYAEALGEYFGNTIIGIFTDEPGLLGKCREKEVLPGTTGILSHVNAFLGYDFTPHLPALWFDDEPEAQRHRDNYATAVGARLEETYYRRLSNWCTDHGIWLCGHPAVPDDIAVERYFHLPGQDIVWRRLVPGDESGLEGPESTQGKCSSSAMVHLGRRRNSNECFGAYGHEFTKEEMMWLSNWCFVRGVNMLIPHAFYYSIRGPRKDERPPDVGPNSAWWEDYGQYADYCRRLSWLNTDSRHICSVAIACAPNGLPWRAAKACFQNQCDFNYLDLSQLGEAAWLGTEGIRIQGMTYDVLVIDGALDIPKSAVCEMNGLARSGRVISWRIRKDLQGTVCVDSSTELLEAIEERSLRDFRTDSPQPDLRYRHVTKDGDHYYLLANEGVEHLACGITVNAQGNAFWIDPYTGKQTCAELMLKLPPYSLKVLKIEQ